MTSTTTAVPRIGAYGESGTGKSGEKIAPRAPLPAEIRHPARPRRAVPDDGFRTSSSCDRRIACRRRDGADCLRVGAPVAGPPLYL